jgi:hypothetical protein
MTLPAGHGYEARPVGKIGFGTGSRWGKASEKLFPEFRPLVIMRESGAGDVTEDAFTFLHHGEAGESGRRDMWGASQLGGASNGGGAVRVFTKDEENGEFIVTEGFSGRGILDGRGPWDVMKAASGNSEGDQSIYPVNSQSAGLPQ